MYGKVSKPRSCGKKNLPSTLVSERKPSYMAGFGFTGFWPPDVGGNQNPGLRPRCISREALGSCPLSILASWSRELCRRLATCSSNVFVEAERNSIMLADRTSPSHYQISSGAAAALTASSRLPEQMLARNNLQFYFIFRTCLAQVGWHWLKLSVYFVWRCHRPPVGTWYAIWVCYSIHVHTYPIEKRRLLAKSIATYPSVLRTL